MTGSFRQLRKYGTNPRVHGNGFLQFDFGAGGRVHIFGHPDIPRQVRPTPIHDHKFGFESRILAGLLVNVRWTAIPEQYAALTGVSHYLCTYEPSGVGGEDTRLVPTEERFAFVLDNVEVLQADYEYRVAPGQIHETFSNEPTITLLTKTIIDPRITPRVFCRLHQLPDNSFTRYDLTESRLWEIAEDAYRRTGLDV